jgi:hypothetical protein
VFVGQTWPETGIATTDRASAKPGTLENVESLPEAFTHEQTGEVIKLLQDPDFQGLVNHRQFKSLCNSIAGQLKRIVGGALPDNKPECSDNDRNSAMAVASTRDVDLAEASLKTMISSDVEQPATMQQKIDAYLTALSQRAQLPHHGDDVELLREQCEAYTKVSKNTHIMTWAKELMKHMRRDKRTMGREEQGPTWSMWYNKDDASFKYRGEDNTFLTPFPKDMIDIGDAMALIVSAELHDKGSAQAFNNVPVMHNCGFDTNEMMDMSRGPKTQEGMQLMMPPSLYALAEDNRHPAYQNPSKNLPPIRYEVSGYGTEDLMERLHRGWKQEENAKKLKDRQSDNARGELLILAVRGRDSGNGDRQREFDDSLRTIRKINGMTGEEFLRIYEDYFASSDTLIYAAVRHYRKVGYNDAGSIDSALKQLREKRLY